MCRENKGVGVLKFLNKPSLLFYVAASFMLIIYFHFLVVELFSLDFFSIYPWKVPQYFFSYEYGLIKRGFVGTIFHLLSIPLTSFYFFIVSLAMTLLFAVGVLFWMDRQFEHTNDMIRYIFLWLFVTSPATFMQLGADMGRYDVVNLGLFLGMVVIIQSNRQWLKAVSLPIMGAVAIAVHEGFFFIHFGVVAALLIHANHTSTQKLFWLVTIAVLTVLALMTATKTGMDTVVQIVGALNASGVAYDADALRVAQATFFQNLSFTVSQYSAQLLGYPLVISVAIAWGYYYYFYTLLIGYKERLSHYDWLLFLSPLSILPMYILGCDFFRWNALLIINMFIVTALLIPKAVTQKKFVHPYRLKILIILLAILTSFGPFGVTEIFPLRGIMF